LCGHKHGSPLNVGSPWPTLHAYFTPLKKEKDSLNTSKFQAMHVEVQLEGSVQVAS